jgi:serine/threonine protein kinase
MVKKGKNPEAKFDPNIDVSDSAKDLVRRMMEPDPSIRISLSEIKEHPWFADSPISLTSQTNQTNVLYCQTQTRST